MGVKGGCSPQNNLTNLRSYYPSLNDAATKISINLRYFLGPTGTLNPGTEEVDQKRPHLPSAAL